MPLLITSLIGCGLRPKVVQGTSGEHHQGDDESPISESQDTSTSHDDHLLGTPETLDIMTWNIEEFPKRGEATIDAVIEVMESLQIDLVALQEISDIEAFERMVDQMPGWEGYVQSEWYAGLAYLYRTDSITVRANYEIYTTEEYWTAFPRSPQVMEFRFRSQEFVVINNHFKCCGDGLLEERDSWDEETRRMDATNLLKDYIDTHFSTDRVIVMGDLNDSLTDTPSNNVFDSLLNDSDNYRFADMEIAEGESTGWSFPSYPSHLDHILITDELFGTLDHEDAQVSAVNVEQMLFDGWREYEQTVSDHRPVAFRIPLMDECDPEPSKAAPASTFCEAGDSL